jgi:hypothetical protein
LTGRAAKIISCVQAITITDLSVEEALMSQSPLDRYVAALAKGQGLHDEFIYSMSFDDYKAFPDPFPRTPFSVREVEARIDRYPNPAKSQKLFQWDIHGRLLSPAKASLQGIAVVMIHGGAVNEFEFIFTPDGLFAGYRTQRSRCVAGDSQDLPVTRGGTICNL